MKKLRHRTGFTLVLIFAMVLGMGLLCFRYFANGSKWAGFSGNQSVYANGKLIQGGIYDRNGEVLYDAASGSYNEDSLIRTATLHAVGDREGMIATSALSKFSGQLSGFNPVFGTTYGGSDLYLTIDAKLNAVAYQAMGDYKGCVAVYNYKTGELLCMVSTAAYDPENVPTISDDDSRYTGVYLNRFYASAYTPGSVFKIVTLAAALEKEPDLFSQTYTCTGSVEIGGNTVNCSGVHGEQNIEEAFANSCNVAFGQLAVSLGSKTLEDYAVEAGLTENHKVNGINTAAGSFEAAPDANSTAWSGIGQYRDLVNPCAMLRLMGAIANDGIPVEPRLLLAQKSEKLGITTGTYSAEEGDRIWSASTCQTLQELMRNNVEENYGQERFGSLKVCAKSGTAETSQEHPTSWFVGFVDEEKHPYAFVVVCEDSGYGSSVAGSIAGKVLTAMEDMEF